MHFPFFAALLATAFVNANPVPENLDDIATSAEDALAKAAATAPELVSRKDWVRASPNTSFFRYFLTSFLVALRSRASELWHWRPQRSSLLPTRTLLLRRYIPHTAC